MLKMEEYGRVIDFLPTGKPDSRSKEPLAYVLGEIFFTILDVTVKPDYILEIGSRVYVGKGERDVIDRIKLRMKYDDLTTIAKRSLEEILTQIVDEQEEKFVRFINICGPVSIRQHQLELLPGIGKKHTEEIINERRDKPFIDFDDLSGRISLMPSPVHVFTTRILEEIKGNQKHYLFAKPPARLPEEGQEQGGRHNRHQHHGRGRRY